MCVYSLSYLACNAHAPYCHLWPAPLYNIFPHYLNIFGKKKSLNTKSGFWFSLQVLSETFFILRREERDMTKMYIGLRVIYPLFSSPFNENWILSTDFRKILRYHISWNSVQWEPSFSVRTDRLTDVTKLIVVFSNFANARKMGRGVGVGELSSAYQPNMRAIRHQDGASNYCTRHFRVVFA
jgi:hypothetical protein